MDSVLGHVDGFDTAIDALLVFDALNAGVGGEAELAPLPARDQTFNDPEWIDDWLRRTHGSGLRQKS